jgi:hypothetical protein
MDIGSAVSVVLYVPPQVYCSFIQSGVFALIIGKHFSEHTIRHIAFDLFFKQLLYSVLNESYTAFCVAQGFLCRGVFISVRCTRILKKPVQ